MITPENQHLSHHIDPIFLASLPLFAHIPSELLAFIIGKELQAAIIMGEDSVGPNPKMTFLS